MKWNKWINHLSSQLLKGISESVKCLCIEKIFRKFFDYQLNCFHNKCHKFLNKIESDLFSKRYVGRWTVNETASTIYSLVNKTQTMIFQISFEIQFVNEWIIEFIHKYICFLIPYFINIDVIEIVETCIFSM